MTDSPDLASWLPARYDEAEQAARAATPGPWGIANSEVLGILQLDHFADGSIKYGDDVVEAIGPEADPAVVANAEHIAALDPSWRLGDIARKRLILAEHVHEPVKPDSRGGPDFGCITCHSQGYDGETLPWGWCRTVLLLAAEFEASPGFVEAWRP